MTRYMYVIEDAQRDETVIATTNPDRLHRLLVALLDARDTTMVVRLVAALTRGDQDTARAAGDALRVRASRYVVDDGVSPERGVDPGSPTMPTPGGGPATDIGSILRRYMPVRAVR